MTAGMRASGDRVLVLGLLFRFAKSFRFLVIERGSMYEFHYVFGRVSEATSTPFRKFVPFFDVRSVSLRAGDGLPITLGPIYQRETKWLNEDGG